MSIRDDRAANLVAVLESVLAAWVRAASTPAEVGLSAAATLATLDRSGARSITGLAESEHVSQPAMTQLVARLERDGLVERRRVSADQRVVSVEITSGGHEVLARRRHSRAERMSELFDRLGGDEQRLLLAALPALAQLAENARAAVGERGARERSDVPPIAGSAR